MVKAGVCSGLQLAGSDWILGTFVAICKVGGGISCVTGHGRLKMQEHSFIHSFIHLLIINIVHMTHKSVNANIKSDNI